MLYQSGRYKSTCVWINLTVMLGQIIGFRYHYWNSHLLLSDATSSVQKSLFCRQLNKQRSSLRQDFCWAPGVSKEVKLTFSMQMLPSNSWQCCWLAAGRQQTLLCTPSLSAFPSRWLFLLMQLSISSVFTDLLGHMKVGKTDAHTKETRFLEPRGWLHNRNWPQISFLHCVITRKSWRVLKLSFAAKSPQGKWPIWASQGRKSRAGTTQKIQLVL